LAAEKRPPDQEDFLPLGAGRRQLPSLLIGAFMRREINNRHRRLVQQGAVGILRQPWIRRPVIHDGLVRRLADPRRIINAAPRAWIKAIRARTAGPFSSLILIVIE